MASIKVKYKITSSVYLRMDERQVEHMVVGLEVRANGINYIISNGNGEFIAQEIEITSEPNVLRKLN